MYHYPNRLPVFGDGHFLYLDQTGNGSCYSLSEAYEMPENIKNPNQLIAGSKNFKIEDIEIFSVNYKPHKLSSVDEKIQKVRQEMNDEKAAVNDLDKKDKSGNSTDKVVD